MRRHLFAIATACMVAAPRVAAIEIPPVSYPQLATQGAEADDFVPKGWKVEARHRGDLNKDGKDDLVLLLRMNDPRNIVHHDGLGPSPFDTNPRILAVAVADDDGRGYRRVLQNHTLIARMEDPVLSDPLSETGDVAIERGTLKVDLYLFSSAGSWRTGLSTFRFRLGRRGFELIGFDRSSIGRGDGRMEEVSINYLTGKVKIGTGAAEDDALKVEWRILPGKQRLLLIEEVGNGLEFEPQY